MSAPKPFIIAVPDSEIRLLSEKLSNTRFPDEIDDAGWQYGAPLRDIKRLVSHWMERYDWRKHEAYINATLPQFTIDIAVERFGTLNIHFVHKRSETPTAIPLLFCHGWPGSFLEVAKILPLLTSPTSEKSPSFHVVTYSLPGYGFSEGSKKKGFTVDQYAEVGHKLMLALGYNEYVTQGGDWGYFFRSLEKSASGMVANIAKHHTNMGPGLRPTLLKSPLLYLQHALSPYSPAEKAGFARTEWFRSSGYGYYTQQSTQPQTLGYSLGDSPLGLLAWIYEKLVNWTDGYPWTDDEILTWISIYWFSRDGPAASVRIYFEVAQSEGWNPASQALSANVPVGVSYFPKELVVLPKTWIRTLANVVFEKQHTSGGHFAAHEKPNELVEDLRTMFGRGGPAFKVVEGQTGYASAARARL